MSRKPKKFKVRKTVAWMWDMDYLDELSPKDKRWLMKFCDEFYQGAVKKHPDDEQIHRDLLKIRELYRQNNSRNRDVMNIYRVRAYDKNEGYNIKIGIPRNINFKKFKA